MTEAAEKKNWASERRLDYIDFRLITAGRVNREDIERTFGVSQPTASKDISAFEAAHPGVMRYDRNQKCYLPAGPRHASVRGLTPGIVRAIKRLSAEHAMGWS